MSTLLRAGVLGAMLAGGLAAAPGASAATTVTPSPVTFVDTCGTDHDTYIIPNVKGVDYFVDSVKVDPGVHQVDKDKAYIQVFTVAEANYTLSAPATWDHSFDATTGCATATPEPSTSSASPTSSSSSTSSAVPGSGSDSGSSDGSVSVDTPASADETPVPVASQGADATALPHTGIDVAPAAAMAGGLALAGVGALVLPRMRRQD